MRKNAFLYTWLLCGVLCVALLVTSVVLPGGTLPQSGEAAPLALTGAYELDDSGERLPWNANARIPNNAARVVFRGHASRSVLPGEQLLLHVVNLTGELRVNGEVVLTFGDMHPSFVNGCGDLWTSFTCNGVSTNDEIEIRMATAYDNPLSDPFGELLTSLYAGSEQAARREIVRQNAFVCGLSLAVALLGLCMLLLCCYSLFLKLNHAWRLLYMSGFVLVTGCWLLLRSPSISLIFPYPTLTQLFKTICLYLMPILLMSYLLPLFHGFALRVCGGMRWLALLFMLVCVVLQIVGVADLASFATAIVILIVASIALYFAALICEAKRRGSSEAKMVFLPLLILCVGAIFDVANSVARFAPFHLGYEIAFVAFSTYQFVRFYQFLRDSVDKVRSYRKLETDLLQSRISVMLSQIKPHFLYNALNSISSLCLTDPQMADQALTSLAQYLRGNIRSLEQSAPVPFEQELEHVKYYVRIEQLRFGDKLRVVYAIHYTDFAVPTLSLQTLVENAVRHGVSTKPEGGTVILQTEREGEQALIKIIDDGVGFDTTLSGKSADSIGLANAKQRLEYMMNATFDVHSVIGEGTTITIRIPPTQKEEA